MSVLTDDLRLCMTSIRNIGDVAELITDGMWDKNGDVENQIKNSLYKSTECGMWFSATPNGFEIGSIVEGSNAEFSESFTYPVNPTVLASVIDEIESQVEQVFQEN